MAPNLKTEHQSSKQYFLSLFHNSQHSVHLVVLWLLKLFFDWSVFIFTSEKQDHMDKIKKVNSSCPTIAQNMEHCVIKPNLDEVNCFINYIGRSDPQQQLFQIKMLTNVLFSINSPGVCFYHIIFT